MTSWPRAEGPGWAPAAVGFLAAVLTLACAPAASGAHVLPGQSGSLGVNETSETQLRAFEAETLGPDHAAEHAAERRAIRRGDVPSAPSARAARAESTPPRRRADVGRWTRRFKIPVIGINALMLPTGKVMWFAYPTNPNPRFGDPSAPNTAQAWLWNPAGGKFKRIDPPLWRDPADGKLKPANIWCAGQSFTADGRVVVSGGNLAYAKSTNGTFTGLNKVYTFDPFSESWTEQPEMAHGRWYPSQALMPDGRTTIIGGLDEDGNGYTPNLGVDVFRPARRFDRRGTVASIGNRRDLRDKSGRNPGPPDGGLYPHLFWMPSGRLMVAGPDPSDSWFLHDPGRSNQFKWTDIAPLSHRRLWSSAVLVPQGPRGSTTVEVIGGSDVGELAGQPPQHPQAKATTEVYDEAGPPGWRPASPLNIPRSHLNTVLLPDRSMVSVGGGVGTNDQFNQWVVTGRERQIEIYDPATKRWRVGPAQAEGRAYHSTALLLPDGRVVSAGDDYNGGIRSDTAEIYEPPYLFRGDGRLATRPRITSAPATVDYGERFRVATGRGPRATRAALVAPGATTHANDMNQRVVPVTLGRRRGGVTLRAPGSRNIALPGYHMLFLLDSKGVPSEARWVQLGSRDRTAPKTSFRQRGGLRGRKTLVGGARDRSGVRRVEVAVGVRRGRRCRWLAGRGRRFAGRASCRRPRWFDARLRPTGASAWMWSAPLVRPLKRGRYVVAIRAADRPGNSRSRVGRSAARLRVGRG